MKKTLWIAGTVVGLVLAVVLVLSLVMKTVLRSDYLKSIITPKLESFTGRQVGIGNIDVSLFKGIVVRDLRVKEEDGATDFISVKEFVLDYRLLPLLKKQIVIDKFEVISPYIRIRKEENGAYNFSDILEKRPSEAGPPEKKTGKEAVGGIPFAIFADRISVRDARIEFIDARNDVPAVTAEVPEIELKPKGGTTLHDLQVLGYMKIGRLQATLGGVKTETSGRIDIADDVITIDLDTSVGKDVVRTSGTIKDFAEVPEIRMDVRSKHLDLDSVLSSGRKRVEIERDEGTNYASSHGAGDYDYRVYKVAAVKKRGVRASGEVRIDSARYSGYDIRDFQAAYEYSDGLITVSPLTLKLAGGEKVVAEGVLKGGLSMKPGHKDGGLKKSVTGKGVLDLNTVDVKSSKITEAMAIFTEINDLRSPKFDNSRFDWSIRDEKVLFNGALNSSNIKLNPSGTVGFDKRLYIVTDVRLSPTLVAKIPESAKITGYVRDQEGWSTIPLKITGTTEKPYVGINPAGIKKQLQKKVGQKIREELFKGIFGK